MAAAAQRFPYNMGTYGRPIFFQLATGNGVSQSVYQNVLRS